MSASATSHAEIVCTADDVGTIEAPITHPTKAVMATPKRPEALDLGEDIPAGDPFMLG